MISDVLLGRPWITPAMLAVLVVLGPLVGRWLVTRSRLAWGLCGLSLVPVAALTLVPVERELYSRCAVQWSLPTPDRVELFANLVLFVPPVLLAGVALRRPLLALLAGSLLSVVIEAVQALVPAIGRSCDTTDWLCNSLGSVAGALLAMGALGLARLTGDRTRPRR